MQKTLQVITDKTLDVASSRLSSMALGAASLKDSFIVDKAHALNLQEPKLTQHVLQKELYAKPTFPLCNLRTELRVLGRSPNKCNLHFITLSFPHRILHTTL